MPTAQLLHLLTAVPQATAPDPGTIISASTPNGGVLTTSLLDPAASVPGATQVLRESKLASTVTASTYKYVLGRFLSKPLPAQTLGSGNWKIAASVRQNASAAGTFTTSLGCCIATWRPGTGVVTRIADSTAFSNSVAPTSVQTYDGAYSGTVAGVSATLQTNDCLIVEVWYQWANSATAIPDNSLLLNGVGQYFNGNYTYQSLTDTDATLLSPVAITFT